jgi:hypothetical protein
MDKRTVSRGKATALLEKGDLEQAAKEIKPGFKQ